MSLSKPEFGGPENNRYRINWLKFFLGIALVILTASAMELKSRSDNLYTGWSLFGLALVVILIIIVVVLLFFAKVQNAVWPVFAAFVLGMIVSVTFTQLLEATDFGFKELISGVITFGLIGACLIGLAVTRWWRP